MSPGTRPTPEAALEALTSILDLVADVDPKSMPFLCKMVAESESFVPLHTWLEAQRKLQAIAPQSAGRYQQTLSNLDLLTRLVADPTLHPARLSMCRDMTPLIRLATDQLEKVQDAAQRQRLREVRRQLGDLHALIQRAAKRRAEGWQGGGGSVSDTASNGSEVGWRPSYA